jgi:hypothetical protein
MSGARVIASWPKRLNIPSEVHMSTIEKALAMFVKDCVEKLAKFMGIALGMHAKKSMTSRGNITGVSVSWFVKAFATDNATLESSCALKE